VFAKIAEISHSDRIMAEHPHELIKPLRFPAEKASIEARPFSLTSDAGFREQMAATECVAL
jgi:hypothetical protein